MKMNKRKIIKKFQEIFCAALLNSFSKDANFIQRIQELTPLAFASLLCLDLVSRDSDKETLKGMCELLKKNYNIVMGKQGLNDRFTKSAEDFLQLLFLYVNQYPIYEKAINLKGKLNRLLIIDSTGYQLNKALLCHFVGCGGSGSPSSLKIYNQNDWLGGVFTQLKLADGKASDSTLADYSMIEAGDLILQDLGFNNKKTLGIIDSKGAYYVSRVKASFQFHYEGKAYKIADFLLSHGNEAVGSLERFMIHLEATDKHPIRMVCRRVSKEEREQRIAHLEKEAAKKGRTLSDAQKCLAGFNVHVTNIAIADLADEELACIYSIRWQIENGYKEWKQLLQIKTKKKIKRERLVCQLWGKLIALSLQKQLIAMARAVKWKRQQIEISSQKCVSSLIACWSDLSQALRTSAAALKRVVYSIENLLFAKENEKEKRKGNKYKPELTHSCTPMEILHRNGYF
jgi:hypothetical protein